jgi:YfiH family protein
MTRNDWITPAWPAPPTVRSLITTRSGGVSTGIFRSMNLGLGLGDDRAPANRAILRGFIPSAPVWVRQTHGSRIIPAMPDAHSLTDADASFTQALGVVCAILSADCLPVLLCDEDGTTVAAAHAGWRGLAMGILRETVKALPIPPEKLMAYFGPAIGAQSFEVGDDVRRTFLARKPKWEIAFQPKRKKWLLDIQLAARIELADMGVARIFGADLCTFSDPERFFSHRRDGVTGRMASLIWLEEPR